MSRFLTRMDAKTLVTRLHGKGHMDDAGAARLGDYIQGIAAEREQPLYLRILSAIGAMIATGCLMAFLGITRILSFNSAPECLLWGVLFIANAIVLLRQSEKSGVTAGIFLMQASFCSMGVGKALVVCAAAEADFFRHFELWPLVFALGAVSAATWNFYKLSVDRFASAAGVLLLLFAAIMTENDFGPAGRTIALNGLVIAEVAAAAWLFTSGKLCRAWAPLAYALVAALSVKVALLGIGDSWFLRSGLDANVVSVILGAAMIGLTGWAADGLDKLKSGPLAVACLGIIVLSALGTPGIIFSLLLMVLGYALHDRKLLTLGILMLPLFIWSFYFHMHVTLLAKSGILIFSGAVLLGGWVYMAARDLDRDLEIKELQV
jgi:hypothetical protein